MAFLENTEEFYQWSNKSENDIYLQGNSYKYAINNSSLEWNNATGQYNEHQGYMNAVGRGCDGGVSCSTCHSCGGGCQYTTCNNGCCQQIMIESTAKPLYGGEDISRRGWRNAGGDPSINVGGETFNMQPTLAWNQGDFFGQPQGFGASQKESAQCNCCRVTNNPRCCHDCRSRQSGMGIPQGMGVQYTQI